MHAYVHSASVGPIRITAWPADPHSLSVITPRNVCCAGAATAAPASNASASLFTRDHEMRGRRTRVHDPHAAATAVFRQTERRHRGARHRDGHVPAAARFVRPLDVIEDRAEL